MNIPLNQLVKILFFVAWSTPIWAQLPAEEPIGYLYKKDWFVGLQLSTNGFGAIFSYERNKTYNFKQGIHLYTSSLKTGKETRKTNSFYEDSKSYVYGKINLLYAARIAYGMSWRLYERKRERGVSIRYQCQIGPSFGLIKPIYLKIKEPYTEPAITKPEDKLYDPTIHYAENIYGRSSFWKGFIDRKFAFGVFGKTGFQFDFSPRTSKITAVEIGVQLDYFSQPIPLFYLGKNKNIFPGLYASVQFGKNKI